jgi:hypothetical protein
LGHAFFSGTDSTLWVAKLVYAGTFLVFIFLAVYWLALLAVSGATRSTSTLLVQRNEQGQARTLATNLSQGRPVKK